MVNAKTEPITFDLPDVEEWLDKLAARGAIIPMAQDPVTAAFNFGTAALMLVGKVIDTVPADQHAENWDRIDKFFERLESIEKLFNPGG